MAFNSRTPKGATMVALVASQLFGLSIHAPQKVRRASLSSRQATTAFNSRTPKGATASFCLENISQGLFQFTHPKRCDLTGTPISNGQLLSIHAPQKVRQKHNVEGCY